MGRYEILRAWVRYYAERISWRSEALIKRAFICSWQGHSVKMDSEGKCVLCEEYMGY